MMSLCRSCQQSQANTNVLLSDAVLQREVAKARSVLQRTPDPETPPPSDASLEIREHHTRARAHQRRR
jgi:hypothetical protein